MRTSYPFPGSIHTCGARVTLDYRAIHDLVHMFSDSVFSREGSQNIFGLDPDELHSYRFESLNGLNYRVSVDGQIFMTSYRYPLHAHAYVQFGGEGGCRLDDLPSFYEWDFVRFGTLSSGEQIVSADPPPGILYQNIHSNLDRFAVTFDSANYVYIDDITVEVDAGILPQVIQTRRLNNGEPDTVEIVLDRPIAENATTRFTFDDGEAVSVVEYFYAPAEEDFDNDGVINADDLDPTDPHICQDVDQDGCDDCTIGTDGIGPLPDNLPDNDGPDADNDGMCDSGDNCPFDYNPSQADTDGDGTADACEECPLDANKIEPGICGCGEVDEGDEDNDTVLDCVDQCMAFDDLLDYDNNGIADCVENVPTVSTWGLLILTLLLLTAAKVYFRHHRLRRSV